MTFNTDIEYAHELDSQDQLARFTEEFVIDAAEPLSQFCKYCYQLVHSYTPLLFISHAHQLTKRLCELKNPWVPDGTLMD